MEERQIRILLIEDNPGDTRLLQEALAEVGETSIDLECVSELSTGLTRLAQGGIDLVLLDLGLPDSQGLETLGRTHGAVPEVPIVVLTGLGDDGVAVHALRRGAQDYLVKGQVESGVLRRTIRYAIERHRMQVALRESEARKGAILEAALDCIVTMDHEGRIVEFNPAAERTFGYTRAEVLGKEMVEVLIPPALREPHRLGLKHYLATGEGSVLGKRLEMPAMRADGSEFPVEVAVTRIPLPGPPMFSGAIRDLTERKRAEKTRHALYLASLQIQGPLALRERLDRILQTAQTLLELERVNILLADREGQWLQAMASLGTEGPIGAIRVPIGPEGGGIAQAYLNRQIVAWDGKGRVPEPLRLQPPYDRIEALRSQVFANVPLIVQGRAIGILVLGADRKRSRRPLDAATVELLQLFAAQAALAIEHGRLYEAQRMAAIQLEATVEARTRELQDANAKLEAAVRLAEEASRHKSEFLANTSHEFRTPLNSILGFSELLKDRRFGPLTEKEACYVNNIWTSGKHLLHVINDILDLSKVEAGRIELKFEPFHLTDALQATLNTIRPQAEAKGVQLQLNGDRCSPTLVADPTRFKQILYNLLSNAVKFTPEGGQVRVTARLVQGSGFTVHGESVSVGEPSTVNRELHREFVEVSVQDTGIGIKAEDRPKLFQPFTQLEAFSSNQHPGTGLGLSLTKRLVELHGGQIWVESEGEKKGSNFTFSLPIAGPSPNVQSKSDERQASERSKDRAQQR